MPTQRSLVVFFPLAFLLSWYPYILGKTHLVHTSGGINPLGPAVAALIVAGAFYRSRGVKQLLARYLPWRARWSDYVIAIVLPVLLVGAAALLNILLGSRPTVAAQPGSWSDLLPRFVFVSVFHILQNRTHASPGEKSHWLQSIDPEGEEGVTAGRIDWLAGFDVPCWR